MDIYDLAIKLGLADGVSGGLTMIVNQFTSLRVSIRNTQTLLQSFEAALGASIEWRGGKKILHGMGEIITAGGAVLDQQALMLAAGWKHAEVAQMTATAYRTAASVMAATPASALQAERTLLGIFGNVREAQAGLTAFLQTEAVMTAAGRGAGAERQLAYGLKALDIQGAFVDHKTGQFSISAYKAGTHELTALMLAIPHTLDMNQLMLFTRMAGPAAQAMTFQDYARTYGEVIASMGRTGGRGLQMLYKTFLGGNVSKALADELIRAGLVKPGAIRHIAGSSRDILDYHGIVGWQELTTNAADWAHDVLFPMLAKHGFKGVPGMMQAVGSLPVTVQRLLSFLLTNWAQVERGKATIERAERTDNYDEAAANSWSLNVKNFEAAWQGLEQALGSPMAAGAIPLMQDLARGIKSLTEFLEDHPDVADLLDSVAISLGTILTLRGLGTGIRVLEMLSGKAGLAGLVGALGPFAEGGAAAIGLRLLTSKAGLFGLAVGVTAFAASIKGLPPWFVHLIEGAAYGAAAGRVLGPGGAATGAVIGGIAGPLWFMNPLGLDNIHVGQPMPLVGVLDQSHVPAAQNPLPLPPPLPPAPPPLPLPLPPLSTAAERAGAVNVTVTSPVTVTLPLPPMSPADIRYALQTALIQGIDPATLNKLAGLIAQGQATALEPLLAQVVRKTIHDENAQHQQHQKRRTFLDLGSIAAWGGP